jgi:hypothetical protein
LNVIVYQFTFSSGINQSAFLHVFDNLTILIAAVNALAQQTIFGKDFRTNDWSILKLLLG